ncbi:MAG: glycosyltransferase family 1 protein [Nitrosopumilales archaeon]|nr:MAG: glycosyltransferase family 1 protein [Nitrosopumilales archaeon]
MNVLLLSQLFSKKGGGEYVFSLIAKNLVENGNQVWVITNRIIGEKYPVNNRIKIIFVAPDLEYRGGLPPSALVHLRYIVNAVIQGLKIIKKEKIDIIHSNNFAPALAGSILSYFTSKPHIITIHDVLSLCGKNYWKIWGDQIYMSKFSSLLPPFLDKLMVKLRCSCIHTVSETTKDDLVSLGAKKPIHVISNAIEESDPIQEMTNPLQFVYVGRLLFSKNLEVAIRGISIAKKKEPNIKLIIVGDGPHKNILQTLTSKLGLKSNIEFKGHVSEEEKMRLIANSTALVFPSLCEGFGLVILEAFLQNKPVMVSDVRPSSDIITHEVNGYVLNPYDGTIWADCFLKIISNPQEAVRLGKSGNNLLKEKYDEKSMYKKIISMYIQYTTPYQA